MSRSISIACLLTLLAFTWLAGATSTPWQDCQKGRYAAAAKYAQCDHQATSKYLGGTLGPPLSEVVSRCRLKYAKTWAKLQAKAAGSGTPCDGPRFVDNGNGTVTDGLTGLQWEQKTDDGSVHDTDNFYTWSVPVFSTVANGTAFTSFFPALNGGGCFTGQCDWRPPTRIELQTIELDTYPCTANPCIDEALFGPNRSLRCGTSSPSVDLIYGVTSLWTIDFASGDLVVNPKEYAINYRAVRGGL